MLHLQKYDCLKDDYLFVPANFVPFVLLFISIMCSHWPWKIWALKGTMLVNSAKQIQLCVCSQDIKNREALLIIFYSIGWNEKHLSLCHTLHEGWPNHYILPLCIHPESSPCFYWICYLLPLDVLQSRSKMLYTQRSSLTVKNTRQLAKSAKFQPFVTNIDW